MMQIELLHSLFDALPDAMVLLRVEDDSHFRYERASRLAYMKGFFSEHSIGKLVTEAHPRAYALYLQEKYLYAVKSKKCVVFNDVVHSKVESFVQQAMVTPVIDASGRCQYLIAEVSQLIDGSTTQRVEATRSIFESFFNNTREQVVLVRHGDRQIEVTDAVLRKAMAEEQFIAEYQPLINPQTGRMEGVEVLVRWNHPEIGRLPPLAFISAAEQLGCLVEIDLWVMHRACLNIKDSSLLPIHLSVNIATEHLRRKGFIDDVKTILQDTNFPAEYLILEITESALMGDLDLALEILNALCLLGVKVAIDDFGTGYSSLSYLKDLPVHVLKIDRSFVASVSHDIKSRAIVETISHLGRELGLKVVSEGVETSEQLQFVRGHCDMVQGYIYSRPVSLDEIETQFCVW